MTVLTIYCCGTGFNRDKVDIVSTLNLETASTHTIVDGPGSGPGLWRSPEARGYTPGASGGLTGGLAGVGIDANLRWMLDWVAPQLVKHPIRAINLCGWSRGGITSLKFAHALMQLGKRPERAQFKTPLASLRVNIFAIDPVPGKTGPANWDSWKSVGLSPLVRNYFVVYAQHESRGGFAPVLPSKLNGPARLEMMVMPGTHSSVAGTLDNLDRFGESAELVQDLARRFLLRHGTQFVRHKLLDTKGILERYAKILASFAAYQQIGKQGFGMGGLGVGSAARTAYSDRGEKLATQFTPEKIPGFFVNDHHREAMLVGCQSLTGFLDAFAPAAGGAAPAKRTRWQVDEGALRKTALDTLRHAAINDIRRMQLEMPLTAAAVRTFLASHGESI